MSDTGIRIDLENAESYKRIAHIAVEQEHMEGLRAKAAEKLAKKVKIDGFRPGKVPAAVVRKNWPGEVEQDAFEALVPEVYKRVLDENSDLHPVSDPRVENLDLPEGQPLSFDLIIEVRPDVEITGLDKLEATRFAPPITDERVEEALSTVVERQAEWTELEETSAEEGDAVLIDYAPLDDEGERVEDDGEKDHPLLLGSDGNLPEFNAALVGMQAGEETDIEVNYPVDYANEELKGSTRTIRVEVKQVRRKSVPELTDEFAAEHTQFENLEELRSDAREQLTKGVQREGDKHLRDQLIDGIIAANEIPVPPSLEARYVRAMVDDMARQQGAGEDFSFDDETRKKIEEAYRPMAARAVQKMVIVDNLRRANEIEVSDEDVDARIEEMAAEQNSTKEQLKGLILRAGNMERLRADMEEEKVFAMLEEQAKIMVKEEMPQQEDAAAAEAGNDDSGE